MKELSLTVNIESAFRKIKPETIESAKWQEVESALLLLRAPNSGSVTAALTNAASLGPVRLQVFADADAFYLMLGEHIEENGDLDYNVRSFTNLDGDPAKKIEIGAYLWPQSQVCYDINLVIEIFRTFCDHGDVSEEYLS
jgi:hypothetical protein